MTLAQLTAFLGWCTLINVVLLTVSSVTLMFGGSGIRKLHARLLHLDEAELNKLYVTFLAHYKILIFVFNLVPYIALRIIA